MNIRTRKLLSILLAVSLVFSLNITAFGAAPEKAADGSAVILVSDSEPGTSDYDKGKEDGYEDGWYDGVYDGFVGEWNGNFTAPTGTEEYVKGYKEGYPEGYSEGWDTGYSLAYYYLGFSIPTSGTQERIKELDYDIFSKDANGNIATKVDLTSDAIKISGLSVNKLTDLRETFNGRAVIETILSGRKPGEDSYLVNKKDIKVSGNYADYYEIEGMEYYNPRAYYDVVELDDGNFLFLAYSCINASLGWVSGVNDPIPVLTYTGQKTEFAKPKAKDNKGKRYVLDVDVALVKFANGTIEKIPGAYVTGTKVDKNGKDASVSGETIPVKASRKSFGIEYKDSIFIEFVKAGNAADIPTFTVKVKAKDAAKSSNKAINKALKEKKYQFAISQKTIFVGIPGGSDTDRSSGTLSFNTVATYNNTDWDQVDKDVLDFSFNLGFSGIKVTKYNGKKATVTSPYGIAGGKTAEAKLKEGKDYTLEKGKLGESSTETAYIKEFKGNYMYSNSNGIFKDGYMLAFRQSPDNKKLLRGGVYKAEGDGFVYSAE